MKSLLIAVFCAVMISCVWGAPLRNLPTEIEQPDGSKYPAFITGDEYYHRTHDAKGFTIIPDPETGWFVYAERSGTNLIPSRHVFGQSDPEALGLSPNLTIDKAEIEERVKRFRGENMNRYGRSPTTGTVNNICIFLRFSDQAEYTDPISTYDTMFNSSNQVSMQGYFLEDSGGQLTVNTTFYPSPFGGVVTSYQDMNPKAYYQWHNPVTNPIGYQTFDEGYVRLHIMLLNAVQQLSTSGLVPPGLDIDADNDGSIDNLTFICQGPPDSWSDALWYHNWVLDHYHYNPYPPYVVPLRYINGKKADEYNFELQVGIDTSVICHEFSHTLGFPDLYHYSFDGIDPCGWWDLMDTCQGTPQHHLTYLKWKYGGWFGAVPLLPPSGVCTLNAVANNPFDCYMYQMPTGEQIWIEYRKTVGLYETRLPGSGLLIYRVDQSYYPNGNDWGPPDEVYVYRPFVTPASPNGNINWANYAWEQAHTAINQFTDPAPFSQSAPGFIALLNIHSIGTNTGSTISFEVGTQVPVIWTGAMDSNWSNGSNWTTGMAPTATDLAIVVQGMNNCSIYAGPTAVCNELRVQYQLNLYPGANLIVGGDLNSFGRIFMDGNLLQVNGDCSILNWYAGSWLHCTVNPTSQIMIGGNCFFDGSTSIQLSTGSLEFINPGTHTFQQDAFATFYDININKAGGTLVYTSIMILPAQFPILGSINVGANATFNINTAHDFSLHGNINVHPLGQLLANAGTIYMQGMGAPQAINIANPTSFLNNLKIDNPSGLNVNLANNMTVRGMLSITQGTLAGNSHTIFLQGEWSNMVGPGGFQKGTSRVVFCGNVDQHIQLSPPGMEDFYTLELNKPSGYLHLNMPGALINCDHYDYSSGVLKVTDGTFNVSTSLLNNCIAGDFICDAPGVINLTNMAGTVDLNANLLIQGGTIMVFGGIANSLWPGALVGINVTPGITMNGGLLIFHNVGVMVGNPALPFVENITGGNIQVNGDFEIHRSDFHPTGGVIEINGMNPANVCTMPGGAFWDLFMIANQQLTSSDLQVNGTLMIQPLATFNVLHNVTVNGGFLLDGVVNVLNPVTVTLNGPVNFQGGSVLDFQQGMILVSTSSPMTMVDGAIMIEDGTFDARNHELVINPSGSIAFGTHGGGGAGKLICAGLNAVQAGTFNPSIGTLELGGNLPGQNYNLALDNGNNAFDLVLNTVSPVILGCDLYIEKDFHLLQGMLDVSTNNYQLWVKGDWIDTSGTDCFMERYGTVNFHGPTPAVVNSGASQTTFHNLNASKDPSISLSLQSPVQVNGDLHMMSSCVLNVDMNLSVGLQTWLDGQMHLINPLTANFNGTFNSMGGSQLFVNNATCNLNGSAGFILQGSISLINGLIDAKNRVFNFSPTASLVFSGGGGGRVKCASFYADHPGNFTPGSGILEIASTMPMGRALSLTSGNYAHDLIINSTGDVTTLSDIHCLGDLDILAGKVFNLAHDTTVFGNFGLFGTCNLINPITLQLNGGVALQTGSLLNIQTGTCSLQDVATPTGLYVNGGINIMNGTLYARNHELHINSSGTIVMGGGTGGYIVCGSFYATHTGNFTPANGSLELGENISAPRSLNVSSGNYLYNLNINSTATVTTLAPLQCNNDCAIQPSKVLNLAYNATVGGAFSLWGTCTLVNPVSLNLNGGWQSHSGSQLNVNDGTCSLFEAPAAYNQFVDGTVSITNGSFIARNHNLLLNSTASLIMGGGGGHVICGSFSAPYTGNFTPSYGLLELGSNIAGSRTIDVSSGNFIHNLRIGSAGPVSTQSTVHCYNDCDIIGGSVFNLDHATTIDGDLDLYGTCTLTNPVTLLLNGALEVRNGSQLNIHDGICRLANVATPTDLYLSGTVNIYDGALEARNHELRLTSSGVLALGGGGAVGFGKVLCGSFYAPHSGNFTPTIGTLELGSNLAAARYLNVVAPNYVPNLKVDSQGAVTTQAALQCNNDCDVLAGSVLNLAFDTTVDGDLDLYGTINLTNPITLLVHGHPTFASGSTLNVNTGTFICDEIPGTRDNFQLEGLLQITSGTFELENYSLQITYPGMIVQSGGTLRLDGLTTATDGRYQPTGGTLELTANLDESLCELTLPGSNHVQDLVIDTNAGIVLGSDVLILGDLDILNGFLDVSTSDYDIEIHGSWFNDSPVHGFIEREASVSFKGDADASIDCTWGREEFHGLIIDKSLATVRVALQAPIATTGDGYADVIKGVFSLNGLEFENSGNTNVYDGGTLLLDAGSTLATGLNHMVNIYSGGNLITRGSGRARSKLKGKDEQEWKAKAHSGSNVKSSHTDYENMKEEGFLLDEYATADPDTTFKNCSFSDGAANCTYLTVYNTQDLVINGASFNSSGSELYNVAKLNTVGSVTLINAGGNFAGPAHENDPHNLIHWVGFLPNLTISNILVSDLNPYVADQINYTVSILNDSDNPSIGNFNVHLFKHRAEPPEMDETGDLYLTVGNIAAHETVNVVFEDIYSMVPAVWTSWVLLDPEDAIQESDEEDNLAEPIITWQALPDVQNISIVQTGATTARLTWSFPLWCDRYKIRWDSDPYGEFTNHLGDTIDSFFDVSLTTEKRFYRVTAERDEPGPAKGILKTTELK